MACPTLLHSAKIGLRRIQKTANKNEAVEIKFFRSVKHCTRLDEVNVKICGKS